MSGITNGTGDYNHQVLKWEIPTATLTNNVTSYARIQLPIQRLPTKGKSQVLEVTKVHFFMTGNETGGGHSNVTLATNQPPTLQSLLDPSVIVAWRVRNGVDGGATGANTVYFNGKDSGMIDMTDGSGRGLLVGTDNMYLCHTTNTNGGPSSVQVHLYYRFKNVGVKEYVGMLQSQLTQ